MAGCHVYVCGAASMAYEVSSAIAGIVGKEVLEEIVGGVSQAAIRIEVSAGIYNVSFEILMLWPEEFVGGV